MQSLWIKGTVHHVVGDEKTTVTMVLNKNLWLEINANTSSNERMPARHRSLWRDWLCSLQFVSVLYSSHKYPQLNHGYGSFFATYNKLHCSLYTYSVKIYGQHWAKTTNKNKNVLTATSLHIIINKLTTVEVRRQ